MCLDDLFVYKEAIHCSYKWAGQLSINMSDLQMHTNIVVKEK